MNQTPPPTHSTPTTSGLAITSLITGILGIFPVAIITGHIALSQIKKSAGQIGGFGMALAGTILGYVGLVVIVLLTAISILFVGARAWKRGSDRAACILQMRNVQQAVRGHQGMHQLQTGDTIDWNAIFGTGGLIREPHCLAGGTYSFAETIPATGTLVVTCDIEDHAPTEHSTW